MKKILLFVVCFIACWGDSVAAVRGATSGLRQSSVSQRVTTTDKSVRTPTARTAVNVSARSGVITHNTGANTSRAQNQSNIARSGNESNMSVAETRTGAEYERCKTAYFTCMDQFCLLKNDNYRRCSCTNRVNELADLIAELQEAGDQLSVFTENLDVVGMSAAQAKSMRTPSEGESALASDTSASKAILEAIMNSIRGESASVAGKYSDLNSLNLSFDTVNAFGTSDIGQTIAAYNGQNLYAAVYPQCRQAVRADCNNASLQRAITAYLMAIEQDCNTVQTAIENKQAELKSALREGSAMLDLARIENRQTRNSYNFTQCINNIEQAILSEEVCGAGYHKCLDNGQYIDVSTGAPIKGVPNFYKLGQLLTFDDSVDALNQKLSKTVNNLGFVKNFESRVKKFAEPALAKCSENADSVWSDYLDKAMLDIYYAQKAKVAEIKQGCFDFVSSCYMNTDAAITTAMRELLNVRDIVVQPDAIALNGAMCRDYVDSCNNMFDGNIVAEYIKNRQDTDVLTACRAIVKQCFDSYGGTNYENFYYPYSGLFGVKNTVNEQQDAQTVYALDWFTLRDKNGNLVSECAEQLTTIDACNNDKIIEEAFGGFDRYDDSSVPGGIAYGIKSENNPNMHINRGVRAGGVATEIYNQILDVLSINCANIGGKFVAFQNISTLSGYTVGGSSGDICKIASFSDADLVKEYGLMPDEDMCPRGYKWDVDINSWGFCSCWENGYRRTKNGQTISCFAGLPVKAEKALNDRQCEYVDEVDVDWNGDASKWCSLPGTVVCPFGKVWNSTIKQCVK
ncbi:MAG: hypothetical protein KBS86_02330 [Proteobacteria bacterium]|nr:hypothetical protein [Candidatus Enterousia scatequi]